MVDSTSNGNAELQPNTDIEVVHRRPGRSAGELSDDVITEVIRMRTLGIALRKIVDWLDENHGVRVSHETIRRWTKTIRVTHEHVTSERIIELRGKEAHRLDSLMQLAMLQAEEHAGTKVGLDAIRQATIVSQARSDLLGLKLPVRYDVSMTIETEQDRALKAMLEQARLKAEQDRQRVIEAASTDPDL